MALKINLGFVERHTNEVYTAAKQRLQQLEAPPVKRYHRSESSEGSWGGKRYSYSPVTINYSPWNWGGGNSYYYNNSSSSKKEERDPSYALACFFGIIAAVGGAMLSGVLYDTYKTAHAEESRTTFIKRSISCGQWDASVPQEARANFKRLVTTQLQLARLETGKWTNYIVSAAGTMAGGGSMAIGSATQALFWVTAGQVTLIACLILAAWTFGVHCNDDEKKRVLLYKIVGMPGTNGVGLADLVKKALHPATYAITHPVTNVAIGGDAEKIGAQLEKTDAVPTTELPVEEKPVKQVEEIPDQPATVVANRGMEPPNRNG